MKTVLFIIFTIFSLSFAQKRQLKIRGAFTDSTTTDSTTTDSTTTDSTTTDSTTTPTSTNPPATAPSFTSCVTSADCPSSAPFCEPTFGVCQVCLTDFDCRTR
jgi:hypothetical protein